MANQFFVMGIGGTGMRCIESLLHLCAAGLLDDTELHLLALDTDKNNGNFSRLKELKEAYVRAKGLDGTKRVALKDTFFSADVHYYEFSPDYENECTFGNVFNYSGTRYKNKEEADLADLVFTKDVEDFNLRHGYRAQTHLGSMMMYHSIVEAASQKSNNGLKDFLGKLSGAAESKPKVFILGSVFGGTGASSIPIIPQAISEAVKVVSGGAVDLLSGAYFGSTLLTAYFSFTAPTADELQKQKVIATSDKFALNSQVAMMFYNDDTTVRATYQRFYMLGTDGQQWNPMAGTDTAGGVITGGGGQTNDSHYIELLAASAAIDFFRTPDDVLAKQKDTGCPAYVYRATQPSGRLEFQDFAGNQNKADEKMALRLGMLVAFSFLVLCPDIDFVESVRSAKQKEITGFDDMDIAQVNSLKDYFRLMHVATDGAGNLKDGWLRQLHRSAGGGDKFLLAPELFSFHSMREMKNYKWNKGIFRSEGTGKDWKFSVGLMSSRFDTFKQKFIEHQKENAAKNITNTAERLYKDIYDTLCSLYTTK